MDPNTRQHPSPRRSSFGHAIRRFRNSFRKPSTSTRPVAESPAPTTATPAPAPPPVQTSNASGAGLDTGNAPLVEPYNVNPPSTSQIPPRSQSVPLESARPKVRTIVHVERLCHKCGSLFVRTERTCLGCGHVQCLQCPRDPPPRRKVVAESTREIQSSGSSDEPSPPVYERMWKKPRIRIRYICDKCNTAFEERCKDCSSCGHRRCDTCIRSPPKRIMPKDLEPENLKSLQSKLQAFAIPIEDGQPLSTRDPKGEAGSSASAGANVTVGV